MDKTRSIIVIYYFEHPVIIMHPVGLLCANFILHVENYALVREFHFTRRELRIQIIIIITCCTEANNHSRFSISLLDRQE